MSFTVADLLGWLGSGAVLRAGDGSEWSGDPAAVVLRDATLDSRAAGAGRLFVGVPGERTHGARFLPAALTGGASAALVEGEPAWAEDAAVPVVVVDDARVGLREIGAGYLARFSPRVVGITGSNGKTTTKDYTRAALATSHAVGANPGNLNSGWGLPLAVLAQSGDEDIVVLEMGASAPGEIADLVAWTRPSIGCITNIAPAHLEGFGSEDAVAVTKSAMVGSLPADGVAVLPADDPRFEWLCDQTDARIVSFGWADGADYRITRGESTAEGLAITVAGQDAVLPVFGEANVWNAAAAVAIAAELGVEPAAALAAIRDAELSPHRSRLLHHAGRVILDDSYNANPASVGHALRSLAHVPVAGRRWAVLGTMAELGDESARYHREIVDEARALGVDRLVPVGDAMRTAAREETAGLPASGDDPDLLGEWLARESRAEDALLFKGSRSVGLERVLAAMLRHLEPAGNGV